MKESEVKKMLKDKMMNTIKLNQDYIFNYLDGLWQDLMWQESGGRKPTQGMQKVYGFAWHIWICSDASGAGRMEQLWRANTFVLSYRGN